MAISSRIFGLLLLFSFFSPAQGKSLVSSNGLDGSTLAFIIEDADSGTGIEAQNADVPMIPASTIKLVTALAALDILGPAHHIQTRLLLAGAVEDGRLVGDLVLQGGGDVELDLDDLMELVLHLREAGIREIGGRFIMDDHKFLRLPEIHPKQPLDAPYNAGIGPLALAFSRVSMIPDGVGGYMTLPPLVERGPAWSIVARAKPNRSRPIPVRDVGLHAARTFMSFAAGLGISIPEPVRDDPPANLRVLASIDSKPVEELVEDMLLYSNNQVAETLGLIASTKLGVNAETLGQSAGALADYMGQKIGWREPESLRITNHSGLAPKARASANQLASLLHYGLQHHALPEMLATSGWSGSLQKRLKGAPSALHIWAKTGSLDFVSALAGYLITDGGFRIFAIMIMDEKARLAYDSQPIPSPSMRRAAQEWEVRAKKLQDELILRWIRQN